MRSPIHPGEILADELSELKLSAAKAAQMLGVPTNRITQIIAGKRSISADTALRLSCWLGTTAVFWLNLQQNYELRLAEHAVGKEIRTQVLPLDHQPSL